MKKQYVNLGRQPQTPQRKCSRNYSYEPQCYYVAGYDNLPVSRDPGPNDADMYVAGLDQWYEDAAVRNHALIWRRSVGIAVAATETAFPTKNVHKARKSIPRREQDCQWHW